MTHHRDATNEISTHALATEISARLKDADEGTRPQVLKEKSPVYREPEKRLGCQTTWRNGDMSQKSGKSPRQRPHTRPMTDNELQYKTNVIALIGFIVLAILVGLMCHFLGAAAWVAAASGGGVLTICGVQFFKTLQGSKGRKP